MFIKIENMEFISGNKCRVCLREVLEVQKGLFCKQLGGCRGWFHASCVHIDAKKYELLENDGLDAIWMCKKCKTKQSKSSPNQEVVELLSDGEIKQVPKMSYKLMRIQEEDDRPPQKVPKYVEGVTTASRARPATELRAGSASGDNRKRKTSPEVPSTSGSQSRTQQDEAWLVRFMAAAIEERVSAEIEKKMQEVRRSNRQELDKRVSEIRAASREERNSFKRKLDNLEQELEKLKSYKKPRVEDGSCFSGHESYTEYVDNEPVVEYIHLEYLQEKRQDIFKLGNEWALAHSVGQDMYLTTGIAALFTENFGGAREVKSQGKKVGDVAVLYREKPLYYLVTKDKSSGNSFIQDVSKCLEVLKLKCIEDRVTKLAMPKIRVGADWFIVKDEINRIFIDSGIEVMVCLRPPQEWTLIVADESIKVALSEIKGAIVCVDAGEGSTLESLEKLLLNARVTEETREILLYLGVCVTKEARSRFQGEVRGCLRRLLRAAKTKLPKIQVVGAVPDWDESSDMLFNVNRVLMEVCNEMGAKFINPMDALWGKAERLNGEWVQETEKQVGKQLGCFLNSLLDC